MPSSSSVSSKSRKHWESNFARRLISPPPKADTDSTSIECSSKGKSEIKSISKNQSKTSLKTPTGTEKSTTSTASNSPDNWRKISEWLHLVTKRKSKFQSISEVQPTTSFETYVRSSDAKASSGSRQSHPIIKPKKHSEGVAVDNLKSTGSAVDVQPVSLASSIKSSEQGEHSSKSSLRKPPVINRITATFKHLPNKLAANANSDGDKDSLHSKLTKVREDISFLLHTKKTVDELKGFVDKISEADKKSKKMISAIRECRNTHDWVRLEGNYQLHLKTLLKAIYAAFGNLYVPENKNEDINIGGKKLKKKYKRPLLKFLKLIYFIMVKDEKSTSGKSNQENEILSIRKQSDKLSLNGSSLNGTYIH